MHARAARAQTIPAESQSAVATCPWTVFSTSLNLCGSNPSIAPSGGSAGFIGSRRCRGGR